MHFEFCLFYSIECDGKRAMETCKFGCHRKTCNVQEWSSPNIYLSNWSTLLVPNVLVHVLHPLPCLLTHAFSCCWQCKGCYLVYYCAAPLNSHTDASIAISSALLPENLCWATSELALVRGNLWFTFYWQEPSTATLILCYFTNPRYLFLCVWMCSD